MVFNDESLRKTKSSSSVNFSQLLFSSLGTVIPHFPLFFFHMTLVTFKKEPNLNQMITLDMPSSITSLNENALNIILTHRSLNNYVS